MDMLTVDVTGLDVSPGDEVVHHRLAGRRSRIDAREMAAADRHHPVGDRVPDRQRGSSDVYTQ